MSLKRRTAGILAALYLGSFGLIAGCTHLTSQQPAGNSLPASQTEQILPQNSELEKKAMEALGVKDKKNLVYFTFNLKGKKDTYITTPEIAWVLKDTLQVYSGKAIVLDHSVKRTILRVIKPITLTTENMAFYGVCAMASELLGKNSQYHTITIADAETVKHYVYSLNEMANIERAKGVWYLDRGLIECEAEIEKKEAECEFEPNPNCQQELTALKNKCDAKQQSLDILLSDYQNGN